MLILPDDLALFLTNLFVLSSLQQESSKEVSDMEHKLKSTTRTGHSLVKTSPRESADQILETLKKYTETFKSNKKSIAEKIKYVKILLPNIESFEHGITAINAWLDIGESLIQEHELNENFDKVENWLEAHKVIVIFFIL